MVLIARLQQARFSPVHSQLGSQAAYREVGCVPTQDISVAPSRCSISIRYVILLTLHVGQECPTT